MNIKRAVFVSLLFVSSYFCALAQNATPHNHAAIDDQDTIDGAANPELIPDNSAYRLWFSAVALPKDATDEQRDIQAGQLAPLRLSDSEYVAMTSILTDFRQRFDAMLAVQADEAALSVLKGSAPLDDTAFLEERDALVNETIASVMAQLSPAAFNRLDAYLQGEKKKMKLSRAVR